MAHALRVLTISTVAALFVLAPISVSAQSTWWQRVGRFDSDLQRKVDALPDTAVQNLPIPILLGVSQSDLTRNFGDPRDGGARLHEGLDIMAPRDTPIVSPVEAVVTRVGSGSSEGNYVYAMGPGEEAYVYMHLSRTGEGVSVGTVLQRGDLIGYVGDTGNAVGAGTHLHFELRHGEPTDPYPRLTHEFTPAEKMASLTKILSATTDTSLANVLAKNFKSELEEARAAGIPLPSQIAALLDTGVAAPAASGNAQLIASLLAQIQALQAQLAALQGTVPSFARDLQLGSTGEDVRALQMYLNAKGFAVATSGPGSAGQETAYFGPATQAALARFQASRGISPALGFFGPITRASML